LKNLAKGKYQGIYNLDKDRWNHLLDDKEVEIEAEEEVNNF
jgi:hypothetical protein